MQVSKRLIVLGIFGLLALPLMGVASAQNLLVNGDFETGDLTGWQVFGQSANSDVTILPVGLLDNGPSLPGTHIALMDNQAEAIGMTLKQSTAAGSASPGMVYYRLDHKLISEAVGGVFFVEIFVEVAGGGTIPGQGSGLQGPFFPELGVWTVIADSFTAPANTDFLTIQIMANTGANADSKMISQVDNVFLTQVLPPVATEEMSMGSIKALFR